MIRIAIEKPCDNEFGPLRCELAKGHTGPHGCATSLDEDGHVEDGVTWTCDKHVVYSVGAF